MWVGHHALTFLLEINSSGDSYARNFRVKGLKIVSWSSELGRVNLNAFSTVYTTTIWRQSNTSEMSLCCDLFLFAPASVLYWSPQFRLVNDWSLICQLWNTTREILHCLCYSLKLFRWHWHSRLLRMRCRYLGCLPGTCGKQLLMGEAVQEMYKK